ncbi:GNAT family N-acetyltransferase [Saccharibacillus kuerlensis]|uniref:Aminoglycoside N(6')-acetyltransferase n=1 Tax=Saccharibacillus kuerlensis TaxID=459527 RepID=A0ABQ2KRV6_9BACL|nr:GNAT family protein [Saccharibacillus kuerlensis]GGN91438.1 aminoglycoside N(6')-acetyltransferase [Saccharibacillus kuerlensis]
MITLEYFEPADFNQLMEWMEDEAFLLQWSGPQFKYPLTSDQLLDYVHDANDKITSSRFIYKAVEEETGQFVGHISLGNVDRYNRSARIGKVLLGRDHRGKGYGRQMINSVLHIGFEEFNLHRISLGVFDFNTSAVNCYEGAGFVREGLIRDARRYQDTYWNLIEMSILEEEWRSGKG